MASKKNLKATVKSPIAHTGSVKEKFDLATIRGQFDDFKKDVNALPDGKQKTSLMNKLENFYLWSANQFGAMAGQIGGATSAKA
jgi:hypothetical protein